MKVDRMNPCIECGHNFCGALLEGKECKAMYYSDPNYEYNVLIRLICTLWEKGVITEEEEKYIVTGKVEEKDE